MSSFPFFQVSLSKDQHLCFSIYLKYLVYHSVEMQFRFIRSAVLTLPVVFLPSVINSEDVGPMSHLRLGAFLWAT